MVPGGLPPFAALAGALVALPQQALRAKQERGAACAATALCGSAAYPSALAGNVLEPQRANPGTTVQHYQIPAAAPATALPSSSSCVPATCQAASAAHQSHGCNPGGDLTYRQFPQNPGAELCRWYVRTGHCKYGDACVFHHPRQFSVPLTSMGLPLRPNQPICTFYLKTGKCKFGSECRHNHPLLKGHSAFLQDPLPEPAHATFEFTFVKRPGMDVAQQQDQHRHGNEVS